MKKIAIATSREIPNLIPAEQPLIAELARRGHDVQVLVWTDPKANWAGFDLVIIRSVWDYVQKYEAFVGWLNNLQQLGLNVQNTVTVMKANSHKFYLENLAKQGVSIVPTVFVKKGSKANIADVFIRQNWSEGVIKPAVSGGAYKTYKFAQTEAQNYQPKLDDLLMEADVLMQEFLPQIQSEGEWSLMFFNGAYSHAVRKVPKGEDFRVQAEYGGQTLAEEPPKAVLAQAQAIMDLDKESFLYARVDGVVVDGVFLLMELELIEPELFLDEHEQAISRFAEAVETVL